MRVILNTARCFLLFNSILQAGDNVRTATATRIHTPPQIKVFLNEEVWQRAQPVTGLLQRDPDEGKPKSERTKIRVLFDHEAHSAIAHSHSAQRGWSIGLELGLRPTIFSEIDFEMSYSRVRDDEAWVMNLTDAKVSPTLISVFGLRDTEERDLTLQVYTQLFLAKGHHDNFRRVVTPEHLVPYDQNVLADFTEQAYNLNVVWLWEYRPGSVLYLVWTQARGGEHADYFTSLRDDASDAFRLPAQNVVLVKASYWWRR